LEKSRYAVLFIWRFIYRFIASFCIIDNKGIPLGLFYLAQEEFLKEGATPIEDIHRSNGKIEGFSSNLFHIYSRAPDI
jgi:hypothetical protein